MKKLFVLLFTLVMSLSCFVLCGCQKEITHRYEAEYADFGQSYHGFAYQMFGEKIACLADSRPVEASNGNVVNNFNGVEGNLITFKFNSDREAKGAKIVVASISGASLGATFEFKPNGWCLEFNGKPCGVPSSIVDYEGNETNTMPKESHQDKAGFVYITFSMDILKGENTIVWKYFEGCNELAIDYIDITAKANLTHTDITSNLDIESPFSFGK